MKIAILLISFQTLISLIYYSSYYNYELFECIKDIFHAFGLIGTWSLTINLIICIILALNYLKKYKRALCAFSVALSIILIIISIENIGSIIIETHKYQSAFEEQVVILFLSAATIPLGLSAILSLAIHMLINRE